MTKTQTASERITEEVTSWPGVEAGPGQRGAFAFTLGRRELGHLHGDRAFHAASRRRYGTSSTTRAASTTTRSSRASPARLHARSRSEDDVRDVIALLRLNYDRAVARHGLAGNQCKRIPRLYASSRQELPFAPSLQIRAFVLERDAAVSADLQHARTLRRRPPDRRRRHHAPLPNHGHEAMFGVGLARPRRCSSTRTIAPSVAKASRSRGTFSPATSLKRTSR